MNEEKLTAEDALALAQSAILKVETPGQSKIAHSNSAFGRYINRENDLTDLAELYHENTKLRRYQIPELSLAANLYSKKDMLFSIAHMKRHIATSRKILLPPSLEIKKKLPESISNRRSCRNYDPKHPLTLQELATILQYAYGVSGKLCTFSDNSKDNWQDILTIPSGGALYPLELFVIAINVDALAPGIYHYNYKEKALEYLDRQKNTSIQSIFSCFPIHPEGISLEKAGALFLISGVFWRSKAKYGERAYRYILQESGHLAQNLCLMSTGLELGSIPVAAFFDDEINHLLHLDGVDEAILYTVICGHPSTDQHL